MLKFKIGIFYHFTYYPYLLLNRFVKVYLSIPAIIILLALNVYASQNEHQFSHITAEDGLSLNAVTEILQDSRGFLWFGTYNGLNRYDGYNFKIFLPEHSSPKSISNHSIWSLYEDSKGYIWIGTLDGLNRYDWRTEEFRRYRNNPKDPNSLSNNYIYSVFEDKSGNLWIGTNDGLNKYNRERDNFSVIKKVSRKININSLNSVTSIQEDNKGNTWFGTWDGLSCLQKDGTFKYIDLPAQEKLLIFYNNINVIYRDNLNDIWIGTKGKGLYKYDHQTEHFTSYIFSEANPNSISDNTVNTVFQDKLGNIWVGTKNGLNTFDRQTSRFTRIFNDPFKPLSISNNEILSINEDKTGILWIGTGGGIEKLYEPLNKFYCYQREKSKNSLSNNHVNSIYRDVNDNLWVGTREGLNKIEPGLNSVTRYLHSPSNNNSLNDNYVWAVIKDHLGCVWIGTDGGGLNYFNPSSGKYKVYKFDENDTTSLSNNGVISLCEDKSGNIWAGTWWGFNLFDRKKEKFTRYVNIFEHNTIWSIYEDTKGMVWFGSDGSGVSMYNPAFKTFTNFIHDSTNTNNFSGNRVVSIFESHDGTMWFGTMEGLNSYDRKSGKFVSYKQENGLLSILVNDIIEDDKGYIWISSDKGLSKFDRKTGLFVNLTKRNGLQEVEFSPRTAVKMRDGELVFGSKSGVIYFNPDSIKKEYTYAPVVFTDFKIYNQSVPIAIDGILKTSLNNTRVISIPPFNDVITFEFALLDYYDVKRNNFQYKLEGFDLSWNDVGSRNNATYTNLPPGKYKFCVKAFSNSGIKNEKQAFIKIIIIPVFYQTLWFKIIFGLGVLLTTILIINYKTKAVYRRNKFLEKRVAERTKDLDKTINELSTEIVERKKAEQKVQASLGEKEILLLEKEGLLTEKEVLLKEIHHRVKNNLQVISSLLYLNSRKVKDKDTLDMFKESQNRIRSIALVHERLYQSKDLGKIDFNEYISKLTHDLLRSYGVNPSAITLEINIRDIFMNVDSAVPCGLIINELISNALKYAFPNYEEKGKTGIISINFCRNEQNELSLVVKDNGVGITGDIEEKKKNSLGLQLVDSLVTQLEGTLEINQNDGTEFKIKLP